MDSKMNILTMITRWFTRYRALKGWNRLWNVKMHVVEQALLEEQRQYFHAMYEANAIINIAMDHCKREMQRR